MSNRQTGLEIKLMHSKPSENRKNRITVAALYNPEEGTMSFGIAKCNLKDSFTKKTGRILAVGRLGLIGDKPSMTIQIEPETDLRRFFVNKFYQIENFLRSNFFNQLNEIDNTPGAELAFEIEKPTATEAEISKNV